MGLRPWDLDTQLNNDILNKAQASKRGFFTMQYIAQDIEKKWCEYFEKQPIKTAKTHAGKKFYCLDMFPYPSGLGLHVGHVRSYVLSDIYARIKWLQGYNVLHPMGWDAFGLPAENDAIKRGIHPAVSTAKNIANFRRQIKELGTLCDWSREINTTDPNYYKWTQWIFLKMYQTGLAYRENKPINWCPSCQTGLANEEVIGGGCERCGTPVEQKEIPQWVLRITSYAEKLLAGLDEVEWPEKVKHMQRNWIGKSDGCLLTFTSTDQRGKTVELPVFTTRPDTMFGVTYLVLAPELEMVQDIVISDRLDVVRAYQEKTVQMSTFARQLDREKDGVCTGACAFNPISKQLVPIYVASYVLPDYGTGIVAGVPAHDERDFEFATKHNVPIIQVIDSPEAKTDISGKLTQAYTGDGVIINSDFLNGLPAKSAGVARATDWIIKHKVGKPYTQYKLRDWIFSRQRYWGEPIPLIHCQICGTVPVPEKDLPVMLPQVERYQPTGTGQSPLAGIPEWVNTACPRCGGPAERETNTMPQWAGSCWYFLRYPNSDLNNKAFDELDMSYWLPVDLYVGGIEHAILHLLYARFYTKVLADLGYLPFNEPFKRLFNQGMICKYSEKTGLIEKMSKSKGNIVNPDDIIRDYGVDAMRMYVMFMSPPELDCVWQDNGLEGTKRFLGRLWNYVTNAQNIVPDGQEDVAATRRVHKLIRDVQERFDDFKPNTAIAAFMEFINDVHAHNMRLSIESVQKILVLLSVLAPHITCELLEQICNIKLADCSWPIYDETLTQQHMATVVVQVNGKMRANIQLPRGTLASTVEHEARVAAVKWLEGKITTNVVYVPDRLINFVIKAQE